MFGRNKNKNKAPARTFDEWGNETTGQENEWYDFPADSTTSEAMGVLTVSLSVLEDDILDSQENLKKAPNTETVFESETPTTDSLLSEEDKTAFLKATTEHAEKKHTRFEKQRAQEIVEREMNSKLTTIDKLEDAVLEEDPGVAKRTVEYTPEGAEPKEITVYDLKGLPYAFLSHAVDYRKANLKVDGKGHIGVKTFQNVVKDPSIWAETREEAERSEGYGTRTADTRGDTISCSYSNSETNPDTRVGTRAYDENLVYGFEATRPDSILYIKAGDGGTVNTAGKSETDLDRGSINSVKMLENSPQIIYNEILLRRYDEAGQPLKPNYIISVDGVITDDMLKHASFFNIPVVNVETKAYRERLDEKAREAVDTITPESSYEEISDVISTIEHSPKYGPLFSRRSYYGRRRDNDGINAKVYQYPVEIREKLVSLEQLEFDKRLDVMAEAMEKEAETYEQANAEGRVTSYGESKVPTMLHFDVEHDLESNTFFDSRNTMRHVPGNPNELHLEMIENGKRIGTTLFDGEHPFAPEEAIAKGYLTQEDIDQADSAPYARMKSLFDRVVSAIRQNNEIRRSQSSGKIA